MDDLIYWLQAITRWVHVLAAILWIGQTYLFNFFERNLEPFLDFGGPKCGQPLDGSRRRVLFSRKVARA